MRVNTIQATREDEVEGRAEVQVDDLAECEIPHQARRRYNYSFFRSTRSAAALKSSPGIARRSAIAARARSSGASPRRSASWHSRSALCR